MCGRHWVIEGVSFGVIASGNRVTLSAPDAPTYNPLAEPHGMLQSYPPGLGALPFQLQ